MQSSGFNGRRRRKVSPELCEVREYDGDEGIVDASFSRVVVALGGNIGDEDVILKRFRSAEVRIGERMQPVCSRWAPVYRSEPVGPVREQPLFLNTVMELSFAAQPDPIEVLRHLLAVEWELGRSRQCAIAQGPRAIDLDLLFVDDIQLNVSGPPQLCLPHSRLRERAFVLKPLVDLFGESWQLPGSGETLADCLRSTAVSNQLSTLELILPGIGI